MFSPSVPRIRTESCLKTDIAQILSKSVTVAIRVSRYWVPLCDTNITFCRTVPSLRGQWIKIITAVVASLCHASTWMPCSKMEILKSPYLFYSQEKQGGCLEFSRSRGCELRVEGQNFRPHLGQRGGNRWAHIHCQMSCKKNGFFGIRNIVFTLCYHNFSSTKSNMVV